MKNWKEVKGAVSKRYCKTCATMDNVHEYHWQGGTICLCDDCLRDFWRDFITDPKGEYVQDSDEPNFNEARFEGD